MRRFAWLPIYLLIPLIGCNADHLNPTPPEPTPKTITVRSVVYCVIVPDGYELENAPIAEERDQTGVYIYQKGRWLQRRGPNAGPPVTPAPSFTPKLVPEK